MAPSDFTAYTKFADLEKYADEYCITKAPFQLPDGLKEFLVKFGPYMMIVGLVLMLWGYITLYQAYSSISQYGAMFGAMYGVRTSFWTPTIIISLLASLVAFGFQIKALPGLLARKKEGWEYMLYASLVSFIPSLVSLQIISLILGFIIGMYILFQLKYMYK
ncbi:MAG: hypothetical protein PHH16_02035 [Candidatus Gracilibacteria bacterium]|nr:hypothetical protein [Candidatus Gracilibacteria bacterium]